MSNYAAWVLATAFIRGCSAIARAIAFQNRSLTNTTITADDSLPKWEEER
jgi:hypothetical protein